MCSGCCGFMFNLHFDCLIDVSGLGRSWFLKEAPRKMQPTSLSSEGPTQSHGWGGSGEAAEAPLPWLGLEGLRNELLTAGCVWETSPALTQNI